MKIGVSNSPLPWSNATQAALQKNARPFAHPAILRELSRFRASSVDCLRIIPSSDWDYQKQLGVTRKMVDGRLTI
jgi:hypothetical protein